MQFAAERCQVAVCPLRFRQPPRLWAFGSIRPGVSRGCIHLRHAARSQRGRLNISAASGPSASPVEQVNQSGTAPAASEIAAKSVPGAQVATSEALDEARERAQQKPNESGVDSSPQHIDSPVVNDSDPRATNMSGAQRTSPSANGQSSSSGQRQGGQGSGGQGAYGSRPQGGRSASRANKRPRTVRKEQLVDGAEFEGTVVSVMSYGAFVDIGSITDGLVHVSQIADAFVSDPTAFLKPGQVVTVRVVSYEEKNSRLSLTMRSTTDSGTATGPSGLERDATRAKQDARRGRNAAAATERKVKKGSDQPIPVSPGDVLEKARVDSVLAWGAFIDVGNGHRGLLHVDEMLLPGDVMEAAAMDIMKAGQLVNVTVLKVANGKIQLTQKSQTVSTPEEIAAEDAEAEEALSDLHGRTSRTLLGSLFSGVGLQKTRKQRKENGNGVTSVPAVQVAASTPQSVATRMTKSSKSAKGFLDSAASNTTPTSASSSAAASSTVADASPALDTKTEKDALERQINPKGSPTPVDLPPEAQKAADEAGVDEAALEGDDSPGGTADQSTPQEITAPSDESAASPVPDAAEGASSKEGTDAGTGAISTSGAELDKGIEEDALQRQVQPKGPPTPVQLPPEVQKAAEEAKTATPEDADKAGTAEAKAQATAAAPSSPVASAPSSPSKESQLPSDAPPEVGEGENPDVKQPRGTEEETEIQVTAPQESEPAKAKPEDIAEGEESPATTKAAATDASQSAASLSGAAPASQLPGAHSQAPEAAPAKPVGQGTTEAERTAPPASAAASSSTVADSAASVGTSSPPAGGGGGSVSAVATGSAVSAQAVKQLRLDTGAGMMDCKRALSDANGDFKLATEALRKKGLAAADKKAGRIAAEGLLAEYIHAGSRLGVLVEINCETDFVAKGDIFKELVNDMAMQVAACPQVTVVDTADVPADVVEKERSIQMGKEDILKKPEQIRGKIVDGRIQKFVSEQALLEQDFIKDTSKTVATVVREASAAIGEKISIRRFERYHLGEGITKKESDLAAEVEQQQQALKDKAAEKKAQGPQEAAPQPEEQQIPSVKVDAKLVKQLRESSGAGMMDCKKALATNDNNLEKATEFLRKKGLASADKKAGRVASEGAIGAYVHAGSKLGVLIEVNCETDFVARGAKFKELVQDLAMQAAASSSAIVVAVQDVPESEIEKERAIEMGKEDIQSKPEAIRPKIVEGRLGKIRSQKALLEQQFIKDTSVTVTDHIKQAIANLGENIQVRRFVRYNLGEGIEKKSQDFAAEVAAQTGQ